LLGEDPLLTSKCTSAGAFCALIFSVLFSSAANAADTAVGAAKTGEQRLKFSARSPLSAPNLMAPRLGEKKLEPDYNLADQEFMLWVADDYTPTKSQGILLLLNFKVTAALPEAVLPLLKQKRMIFVAPLDDSQATWVKVGLGLDAIHNLKKQYAIDDSRIYLFDFDRSFARNPQGHQASAGELLAINYSDIITGSFHSYFVHAWKPLKVSRGTVGAGALIPPPAQLAVAKTHPLIVSHPGQNDEITTAHDRFVQQEGFKLFKRIDVTGEQAHYPLYTTDWVTEVLKYLDDNAPKPKAKPGAPATAPGVRPAAPPVAPAAPKPSAK
jgi:hypothetical protein